ncbi:phospholipid N-methyltransferase [Wolffia australiana]
MATGWAVGMAVLLPFPFYYLLWTFPQSWVDLCGHDVDPSRRMAHVSHVIKAVQLIALLSVADFSWPPWYCCLLFLAGQFLNLKVFQLLGESGTYYGVRFGKNVPWVTEFPFGYIKDPQYVGSILSLVACLCWVPPFYVILWTMGYLFMMKVESCEDPTTRAKARG